MEYLLAYGFGVPMKIADKFLEFSAIKVERRIRRETVISVLLFKSFCGMYVLVAASVPIVNLPFPAGQM